MAYVEAKMVMVAILQKFHVHVSPGNCRLHESLTYQSCFELTSLCFQGQMSQYMATFMKSGLDER